MKFAILVAALLCAQLLSKTAFASSLEPEQLKEALRGKDLTPAQVLSLLKQAIAPSTQLHNLYQVAQFVEISQRDPRMCTMRVLKRIVDMYPEHMYMEGEPKIRDNLVRYSRQQFNELFEYCLKQTEGKAFPKQLQRLYSEDSNKAGEKVHDFTKLEQLIYRSKTLAHVKDILADGYLGPDQTFHYLDSVIEDDKELADGHTVSDFKSTLERDPKLCTIKELKHRIVMHHGEDPDMNKRAASVLNRNLASFCRKQFNGLVSYCLEESEDEAFKKTIGELFKASKSNAAREHPGFLTSMESAILKMP